MITMEAASLPRGVAHTVSRATSSHDRNLQSIPGFLASQYDKSKSPGLNQGLAGKTITKGHGKRRNIVAHVFIG